MSRRTEAELEKVGELRERYERDGFHVVANPGPELFPFDLGGLCPDLLVERGDQHYLVKVRPPRTPVPLDQITEVSREVRKLPGWRFYIVSAEDVHWDAPGIADPLAPWQTLHARAEEAIRLARTGTAPEPAVQALWSAAEGFLRRIAEAAEVPVERLPVRVVISSLCSMGELSYEHWEALHDLLDVRNRLLHGYEVDPAEVTRASATLVAVLEELIRAPMEQAA